MKKNEKLFSLVVLFFLLFGVNNILAQQTVNSNKTEWFDPEKPATTFCNPINIGYNYTTYNHNGIPVSRRSSADPVIITYKGEYYLFATNQAGFFWSKDMSDWNFVYGSFQRQPGDDDQCAPAAWVVNDTLFYGNGMMILNKVSVNPADLASKYNKDETALFLDMTIISKEGKQYRAYPGIALKGQELRSLPDSVISQSLVLKFNKVINQDKGELEIGVKESGNITDLITLKVYEFPMINLLWLGIVIMVIGFVMSIVQRVKQMAKSTL